MAKRSVVMTTFVLFLAARFICFGQSKSTDAKDFVRTIYFPYSSSSTYSSVGPDLQKIFSPGLSSLIRADQKKAPNGYVGNLGFDPLCNCEDNDGFKLISVEVKQIGQDLSNAEVKIHFAKTLPDIMTVQLRLVHLHEGWRVDDVTWQQPPSLRKLLTDKTQ